MTVRGFVVPLLLSLWILSGCFGGAGSESLPGSGQTAGGSSTSNSEGEMPSAPGAQSGSGETNGPSDSAAAGTEDNDTEEKGGEETVNTMKVKIGEKEFAVTLEDNETAAALAEKLPLELRMSELNGNEKYNYLPFSLPTDSCRPGKIQTGDVMLFGDSCIVVFYESFSTSYSYTRIGQITDTAGLAEAVGAGDVTMSFS